MRLYEHEAKRILAAAGLATPRMFGVVADADEFDFASLSFPLMVKAQCLIGGRGKAGGIKKVDNAKDALAATWSMLGARIRDYPVPTVLLEQAVAYEGACYLGVTANPRTGNNVIIASAEGGVEIEQVASERPEAILRRELPDNPDELSDEVAEEVGSFLARGLGGDGAQLRSQLGQTARLLYRVYQESDCKVAEINPLLLTDGGPLCADAKIVLDDNALYRQRRLLKRLGIESKRHDVAEASARERRAQAAGFFYVDLLPEDAQREPGRVYVGLVPGGAGYGIFSIDEVSNVGERYFEGRVVPLNFMDSGGGPSIPAVVEMFSLLMDHPLIDLIITSRFGGISSCDIFIRGLVACLRQRTAAGQRVVPVYGRMVGTDLAAGRAFLEHALRETPDVLQSLSMVVGNQKIMAEVIREALADHLSQQEERR